MHTETTETSTTTKPPTSVFVDIKAPRPEIPFIKSREVPSNTYPNLRALLPWAKPAIIEAARKWIALGNDYSRIAVTVSLTNGMGENENDVHAHYTTVEHDPSLVPVLFTYAWKYEADCEVALSEVLAEDARRLTPSRYLDLEECEPEETAKRLADWTKRIKSLDASDVARMLMAMEYVSGEETDDWECQLGELRELIEELGGPAATVVEVST